MSSFFILGLIVFESEDGEAVTVTADHWRRITENFHPHLGHGH
jgi:hypothetical protein